MLNLYRRTLQVPLSQDHCFRSPHKKKTVVTTSLWVSHSATAIARWHSFGSFYEHASSDWLTSAKHQHGTAGLRHSLILCSKPSIIIISAISWFTALKRCARTYADISSVIVLRACLNGKLLGRFCTVQGRSHSNKQCQNLMTQIHKLYCPVNGVTSSHFPPVLRVNVVTGTGVSANEEREWESWGDGKAKCARFCLSLQYFWRSQLSNSIPPSSPCPHPFTQE